MSSIQGSKWWLASMAVMALCATPVFIQSVLAYSGGFYDDGLYDDDWYFDYYEAKKDNGQKDRKSSNLFEGVEEYEISQLYDNVEERGLIQGKSNGYGTIEKSFLKKAAQEQQTEIAFGKLATQKADSQDVKQFGAKMIDDHQKANQEVRQLASKEGIQLPTQMNEKQREKYDELSQLSGRDFDLAYMYYIMRDHKQDVREFERQAQQLQNQEVKQWASATLPVLKQHLQNGFSVAMSLGPRNLFTKDMMEEYVDVP